MDSKQLEDLLDRLREGIRILGCRSLARPGDRGLLDGLREGSLPAQDFFRELLRAVFGQLVSLLAQRRGMARSDRKEIALEGVSPLDLERLTPGDLGSLYERLLELHPTVDIHGAAFEIEDGGKTRRKRAGVYYTPPGRGERRRDTAQGPGQEEAARRSDPERAILSLKICDPACGSGRFLIAAARRLAGRLARTRAGGKEQSPAALQEALRDAIAGSIYGADLDPLAAEICRWSLWLECRDPRIPESFLDGRILCGNSLIGATPALLGKAFPGADGSKSTADAWCAAFLRENGAAEEEDVERLAREYGFLHWHIAFPDVFRPTRPGERPENADAGWNGGFDVVLGNPPWERVKLQEKEWFAARMPEIARAPDAASRRRRIALLSRENPALYSEFLAARRRSEGESRFARRSGRYPLCGRGDVNVYALFAEMMRQIVSPRGRVGAILPSGIATDETTKRFFRSLVESRSLVSLHDFENREKLFPGVDGRMRFCLLTLAGPARPAAEGAEFLFFARAAGDLREGDRLFRMSAEEIALLNPRTRTCPIFRTGREARLAASIYRRSVLLGDAGNGFGFLPKIDMTDEVANFHPAAGRAGIRRPPERIVAGGKRYLRLYEAKLIWHFDHRWGTFAGCPSKDFERGAPRRPAPEERADPGLLCLPRYFVPEDLVRQRYRWGRRGPGYLVAVRRLTNPTNERTAVFSILPPCGCGNSLFAFTVPSADHALWLVSNGNSFAFDFCARSKVGGTNLLQFILEQLPLVPLARLREPALARGESLLDGWIRPRVLELTCVARDLLPFARACGYGGPPFRWDEERRSILRCELDAAYFHLYGISRDDAEFILETFPIVRRNDEARHGEYRTKRIILERYDALGKVLDAGRGSPG